MTPSTSLQTKLNTVPLTGTLALHDGTQFPAVLCFADGQAFLTSTGDEQAPKIDLTTLRPPTLRYVSRTLGDRLVVNDRTFGIPLGQAQFVITKLALARMASQVSETIVPSRPTGPYIDAISTLSAHWLGLFLTDSERVIAWMETASQHGFPHSIGGPKISASKWFLLTTHRCALVAISRFGDVEITPLPQTAIALSDNRLTRDEATMDDVGWTLAMGGADRLAPLRHLPALTTHTRIKEAAKCLALHGTSRAREQASRLLQTLPAGDPLVALSLQTLAGPPTAEETQNIVRDLAETYRDSGNLVDWARAWRRPASHTQHLLTVATDVLDAEQAQWSLPLHRLLHEQQQGTPDLQQATQTDLSLCTHLLMVGKHTEAMGILEARLKILPNGSLLETLPDMDADLTQGDGVDPLYIHALELLAVARGSAKQLDGDALLQLAQHQPLLIHRLQSVVTHGTPVMARQAQQAITLLSINGLKPLESTQHPPVHAAFDDEHLDQLKHPVARASGVVSALQRAIAKSPLPEKGSIRDYCERISVKQHIHVASAIADCCVALGMPMVPAYLSRGQRQLGMRSYDQPEPFLLIGGRHVDPGDDAHLSPLELRAAIAAELTHLRFQHSRITSHDLWAGVWDKGSAALETSAFMLPLLRFLPVDLIGKQRTYTAVSRVLPLSWLQRIYETEDVANLAQVVTADIGRIGRVAGSQAETVQGSMNTLGQTAGKLLPTTPKSPQDVSLDTARILAAHQMMQLTADRAALVMSGDLTATVRSMFLVHSRLLNELSIAERSGLHTAMNRTGGGTNRLLGLPARIAALIAFSLSEEHSQLRAKLASKPSPDSVG